MVRHMRSRRQTRPADTAHGKCFRSVCTATKLRKSLVAAKCFCHKIHIVRPVHSNRIVPHSARPLTFQSQALLFQLRRLKAQVLDLSTASLRLNHAEVFLPRKRTFKKDFKIKSFSPFFADIHGVTSPG